MIIDTTLAIQCIAGEQIEFALALVLGISYSFPLAGT
jgi:hypothetical protein